jgi:hypothetical protein
VSLITAIYIALHPRRHLRALPDRYDNPVSGNSAPRRIGVIVNAESKLNEPALRSLVLAMNKQQDLVEFDFYSAGLCRFTDSFYSVRRGGCAVIALGNWRRYMAPRCGPVHRERASRYAVGKDKDLPSGGGR